jgi:hypothetical protein
LICPSDGSRQSIPTNFVQFYVSIWGNTATPTLALPGSVKTVASLTSYFICGDAQEAYPQMILNGDRNMGQALGSGQPAANLTGFGTNNVSNGPSAVNGSIIGGTGSGYGPGYGANSYWGWSSTDLHQRAGNLGIADGSVQQATCAGLMTSLLSATNGASTMNPVYNIP